MAGLEGRPAPPPHPYFAFPPIRGQNPWLDALRAIAVILVLLRHGERIVPLSDAGWTAPVHNLFINGWVGVDLFLVLSGYLITKSLLNSVSADGFVDMRRYFWNRILRIVPAYYAVIALILVGAFPFYEPRGEVTLGVVAYHLAFLQDYLPATLNVAFWSLGVEEKFYILAPLLILALSACRTWRLGLALLGACLLISPLSRIAAFVASGEAMAYQHFFETIRSPFHMSLEPLLMGVGVAYLERRRGQLFSPERAKLVMALTVGGLVAWLCSHAFLDDINRWDAGLQPLILAAGFGTLVAAAGSLHRTQVAGAGFWRPTARLSYALYLIHFPLIPFAGAIAMTSASPWIVFWMVYLTLSTLAALTLHFAVEKPFLELKCRHRPAAGPRELAGAG